MTSNLVELPSHDVELFRPTDSSSEEWRQQGLKLFYHGQFAQALYAFKRAHAVEETANTQAYILRDEAREAQSSSARDPVALHLRAAHAFIQRAGVPFNAGSRLQYLWIAGNCLVDGHDFSQAANVYLQAEAYDDAAQQYLRSGNVDAAVSVMREATTLQEDVRQLIIEQACKAYLAKKVRLLTLTFINTQNFI
jgi:tetratricopeptide (TPR) repeat protein